MKKFGRAILVILSKFLFLLIIIFRFLRKCIRGINRRKRYAIPFYSFLAYILLVVVIIKFSGDPSYDKVLRNKRVNDVTAINPIQVGREIQPTTIDEIVEAVQNTNGPISIGGGRFSMGGQTGYENSLHIDMRKFNQVLNLDVVNKQVTVQAGIIWRDLQHLIDRHNLSVKIMQTYANFTVGGSVSVNCHGRYIGHGPIVSSVLHIKLITATGEVITASRNENQEVFAAAIGGYGGIGVIAEVTLSLADNTKVERRTNLMPVADYNEFFNKNVRNDKDVVFQNGDLYPPNYDMINSVAWKITGKEVTDTVRVTPVGESYWLETQVMRVVSSGNFGKWVRRNLIDPNLYKSDKVVWRNREASYDVQELEPKSRLEETYVLQEYFIPVDKIQSFIPKMKTVFNKHDVNVINVSLRHAYADEETYLSWATEEVFAFVVYYKQGTDLEAREQVKLWTIEMTDAILSENGRWYLPYQPHATVEQFQRGYPQAIKYFLLKNRLDSAHRFTNRLIDKYNPFTKERIEKKRASINGYFRDEAQTVLTVPEWYLVFNPKEYSDYLESDHNPSDFPFYASIDEYWKLYDRSMKLVSSAYPENEEYNTMLQVIGVSVTLEYTAKMLYENTIGRVFSWFHNGTNSDDENVIITAQRAYSDFIDDNAWYEFSFIPWVKDVWSTSNTRDSNWLRKIERKLFFTFEFTFKAGYAKLIEWGAKASYEEPVTKIYMLASTNDTVRMSNDLRVVHSEAQKRIISVTRWGAFTKSILMLKSRNIDIVEIGGNDEIVVSVLTDSSKVKIFPQDELLYNSNVVTNRKALRQVYLLPVSRMLSFIKEAEASGVTVEHIFDY
ncbi:MAG: FAD-dependent oxidoreductase [Chryseolinea sp.]